MAVEEGNGIINVYDLSSNVDKPKFHIVSNRAQSITIKPSPFGHAILVKSLSYHDTSGKSYYGETALQYIQIHGGKDRQFVPVFDN